MTTSELPYVCKISHSTSRRAARLIRPDHAKLGVRAMNRVNPDVEKPCSIIRVVAIPVTYSERQLREYSSTGKSNGQIL